MNELAVGEVHPATREAVSWILAQPQLGLWLEAFASCGIEGNRLAAICAETLNRLLSGKPVGDRYVLGLAWVMVQEKLEKNVS